MMSDFAGGFRQNVDINLGVGYVNEQTMPRQPLLQALAAVLADPGGYPNALNYGSSPGSPQLVAALQRFLLRNRVGGLSAQLLQQRRLVIGASGVTSLLDGIAQIMDPGLVVTGDPLYYIYSDYLTRLGFELLPIPEDHAGLRTELLEARIADRLAHVSFFYVVTVGNPTSAVLSNRRRRELVGIVTRAAHQAGRELPLFLDTAYELLMHDPNCPRPESALRHDREGLVYELGTLSKAFAPALRIGYLLGPRGPLLDALVQRTSDVGFSAPLVNQAVASYLLDHFGDQQVRCVNRAHHDRATRIRNWIERYLGDELEELVGGQAGFYFYVTLRHTDTREGSDFYCYCNRATGDPQLDGPTSCPKPRVAYIPGACCVHPNGDYAERGRRQLRVAYGYESLEQIERGLDVFREAIAYARARRTRGARGAYAEVREPCTRAANAARANGAAASWRC